MFNWWFWVFGPLILFTLIGYFIYFIFSRFAPRKPDPVKESPYTCGEPMPPIRIGSKNFYQPIRDALKLDEVKKIHTGDLSDYLLWIVVSVVIMLLLVSLLWM